MSQTTISVDIQQYIEDCWDNIPEEDHKDLVEKIFRLIDCSSIYENIDMIIEMEGYQKGA